LYEVPLNCLPRLQNRTALVDLLICNGQLFYSTDDKISQYIGPEKKNNFGSWVYTATFSFFLDKDERDSFPKGVH